MILPSSTRLYYCACRYLWNIFSAATWLEEEESDEEYFTRVVEWYDVHNQLAGYLLHEQSHIHSFYSNFPPLLEAYRQHQKSLTHQWLELLTTTAQSFAEHAPSIKEGAWLYFLYVAWHQHCLQAFDALLNEPRLRDTPWYTRYQEQAPHFQQLIALRSAERPVLENIPVAQRAAVQAVQDDLERLAETLAQEWREAVEWATEGLPWEQLETALDRPDASPPPAYDDDSIPW